MKRFFTLFALVLTIAVAALLLSACDEDDVKTPDPPTVTAPDANQGQDTSPDNTGNDDKTGDNDSTLQEFTNVRFENVTVTYDGQEHAVTVTGAPAGTQIVYQNNKGTNVGTYNASATLTLENYETKTLTATLTINKATITGVTLDSKNFIATGAAHSLEVKGALPVGATVNYTGNGQTEAGRYTVTAIVSAPNYNDLVLTATMKITSLIDAGAIVQSVLQRPDPWSFLPEGLQRETMAYVTAPVSDFTDFVDCASIGRRAIGKQLNVLYDGMLATTTMLGYIDNVMTVGNVITEVYQMFLNTNPDNTAEFTGEAAGFKVYIKLNENRTTILLGNSVVSIELIYDKATGMRYGRVQATDGIALKYEYTENTLKFAVQMTVAGVGNVKQISFTRENGTVAGLMYEYTGTAEKNLKTTAELLFNDQVAVIVSDKRETDDLTIKGYEEVYNAKTGEFLGGEVAETVKSIAYDTLWFLPNDVAGFVSVRVLPEQNGLNADTVYLNGAANAMKTKLVGGFSLKATSRRYDVEMKDVWYIVASTDEKGNMVYEKVKVSVPMIFVQAENADTFGADVQEKNGAEFTVAPVLPATNRTKVTANFEALTALYAESKGLCSFADIVAYIGENNAFFEKTE